jgi:hypothetical protein
MATLKLYRAGRTGSSVPVSASDSIRNVYSKEERRGAAARALKVDGGVEMSDRKAGPLVVYVKGDEPYLGWHPWWVFAGACALVLTIFMALSSTSDNLSFYRGRVQQAEETKQQVQQQLEKVDWQRD